MNKSHVMKIPVAALLILPGIAEAHSGFMSGGGFLQGLAHPFSGLDHVLAMFAVGLWATQIGGRALWAVPLAFVAAMVAGSVLVMPFAESGIVLSVLMLGVLVAASVRLPLWLGCALAGLFALWHGHVHGIEMPADVFATTYSLGFLCATMALHIGGIAIGLAVRRYSGVRAMTAAGAGITLYGMYLLVV